MMMMKMKTKTKTPDPAEVSWGAEVERQSREVVGRLSDAHWRQVQRRRWWMLLGAEVALVLGCLVGLATYLSVGTVSQRVLAQAAEIQARAAQTLRQAETRRCAEFPDWCRDQRSVFYVPKPSKKGGK